MDQTHLQAILYGIFIYYLKNEKIIVGNKLLLFQYYQWCGIFTIGVIL